MWSPTGNNFIRIQHICVWHTVRFMWLHFPLSFSITILLKPGHRLITSRWSAHSFYKSSLLTYWNPDTGKSIVPIRIASWGFRAYLHKATCTLREDTFWNRSSDRNSFLWAMRDYRSRQDIRILSNVPSFSTNLVLLANQFECVSGHISIISHPLEVGERGGQNPR